MVREIYPHPHDPKILVVDIRDAYGRLVRTSNVRKGSK